MALRNKKVSTVALGVLGAGLLATPALAQDSKTITIATHYNQDQMAPLLECFDAYEAQNPGIKIEFQQASYGDFLPTILTARIGGTSPDIYNIYSIWAPQLVASGALATPPAEVQEFISANYSEGAVDAARLDGTIWGIPTELSVYQLLYNKKLLADAGYDAPPKTWAELAEIAAAVTEKNAQGNITTGGYVYGPSVANAVHPFYSQMYAEGTAPFNEDLTATNFTSPAAIKILERQGRLFADGSTALSSTVEDFPAGRAGMAIMANWNKQGLKEAFGDNFEDTVGVAPIPHDEGDGGTMLYSFYWAVDSTSDVTDESWALLNWLNTAQDGADLSCTGHMLDELGALSGNTADLSAMDTSDAFTTPFVEAIVSGTAKSQPNIWQASENDRILRGYIEQVWAGQMSAEDALAAADAEITAILAEQ
ncbi:ABC transporter substrate-binding protein [Oceaniglobus trochenteri]|uniref:ABC transporter substrate-binding protein n=1 Tax=Oceaniglobus trochenteri TaxID=2763260 RepID=UPI001CFF5E9D|nr:sugar ABC transporter substrate-binding protein [Oceaniglobus trochenteri]